MRTSEQVDELMPDLLEVQDQLDSPERDRTVTVKTKKGGSYSYDYCTLDKLVDHTTPVLNEYGLVVTQGCEPVDGVPHLTTRLIHDSGQWIESSTRLMLKGGNGPQDMGKAMTYARRYSLAAILCLAAETDHDASGQGSSPKKSGGNATGGSKNSDDVDEDQLDDRKGSISENQLNYIHTLCDEKWLPEQGIIEKDEIYEYIKDAYGVDSGNDFSKKQASQIIGKLKSMPKSEDKTSSENQPQDEPPF